MSGHSQPFAQSSQHAPSQPQSGQFTQQPSEQQVTISPLLLQQEAAGELSAGAVATPAAISPPRTASPPNNLINIRFSLS